MICTTCPPETLECSCPVKDLSTDCSIYKGTTILNAIGTNPNTILTQVIININEAFQNFKDSLASYFLLVNTGNGSKIYSGISNLGARNLRTLIGSDSIIVSEEPDVIKVDVKTSSTSELGVIELATQTEVNAGTDTQRAVTPSTLSTYVSDPANLPNSTEISRGIIEIATQAEVDAGTDNERAVTPAKLSNYVSQPANLPNATQTSRGIIELATQTEVNAGTDTQRAVTPSTLSSYVSSNSTEVENASETQRGIIEIATQTEVNAGTDDLRAVTPLKLQQKLNSTISNQVTFVNKAVTLPYTLIPTDKGSVLYVTGTGNLIVPLGLGSDFECGVIQTGTGTTTILGTGTTLQYPTALTNTIAGQYFQIYIRKAIPVETYNLIGNLTTA